MTLMERINLERILDALAEQYEDGRGLSHCMYCGRGDCRHAPEWASRAWSSDCAAMQAVVPSYDESFLTLREGLGRYITER
jgi:hypothetical protein